MTFNYPLSNTPRGITLSPELHKHGCIGRTSVNYHFAPGGFQRTSFSSTYPFERAAQNVGQMVSEPSSGGISAFIAAWARPNEFSKVFPWVPKERLPRFNDVE